MMKSETKEQRATYEAALQLQDIAQTLCMASGIIGAEASFLRDEIMIALKETKRILTDAALSVSFSVIENFDDDEEYPAWMKEYHS